jgi:HEAT repeat protein
MPDATMTKIVQLLQPAQPSPVRCAAAVVLREIGGRDSDLAKTLVNLLDDGDPSVRAEIIQTVGRLRIEQALHKLLDLIQAGGMESELAAMSAAQMGAKGTHALQGLMDKVAPGLRRRIAGALAAGGSTTAETAAVEALLDTDPGVVEAATRSLINAVPNLNPTHRRALVDQMLQFLKDRKRPLTPYAETAVVRLLAALADPRADAELWERTGPGHSPEMRAAALQALGKSVEKPNKDQLKRLIACAVDSDFRVAAPALMILKQVAVDQRQSAEWLSLLQAADVAVRRFAVDKLGDRDSSDVADALLSQVEHPDPQLRQSALNHLGQTKAGRALLTQALLDADNPDKAWLLARAQTRFIADYPSKLRDEIFEQACTWLEEGDRRSDALLFLLRAADAADLNEQLAERALALRKKKAYARAISYLRQLARDPACAVPIRLELAGCGLKESQHDLSNEARAADPALQQFGRLVPDYQAETLDFLKKNKWLDAEDLYYLGFHFAEKNGPPRRFGGEVLKLVIDRSAKAKVAQDAKRKLKKEALE